MCRTKDGQDIKAGGRVRFLYEDDESMSMIIKGVTPEDAGTYTVTAWNDLGEDFAEVSLNVKGLGHFLSGYSCLIENLKSQVSAPSRDFLPSKLNFSFLHLAPPKFKTKMKDQACMTDDTLRVTVEVEGTPAPEISW